MLLKDVQQYNFASVWILFGFKVTGAPKTAHSERTEPTEISLSNEDLAQKNEMKMFCVNLFLFKFGTFGGVFHSEQVFSTHSHKFLNVS